MKLFRPLTPAEERAFRQFARLSKPTQEEIDRDWEIWHPVYREELLKRGLEPRKAVKE